jgi:hypothetical protein
MSLTMCLFFPPSLEVFRLLDAPGDGVERVDQAALLDPVDLAALVRP